MKITRIGAVIIFLGVAACSSGGGNNPVYEEMGYGMALTETKALVVELKDLEHEIPALPVEGTATYNGIAHLDHNLEYGFADVSLIADFADSTISGRMDNFTSPEKTKIDGYVDISNGKIDGQEFGSSLSGLYDGHEVSGTMNGRFYGKDARIVGGEFGVTVLGQSHKGSFAAKE